jgi:hypothetical protein
VTLRRRSSPSDLEVVEWPRKTLDHKVTPHDPAACQCLLGKKPVDVSVIEKISDALVGRV